MALLKHTKQKYSHLKQRMWNKTISLTFEGETMVDKIRNANKLIEDLQKKMKNDDYRTMSVRGIRSVSKADLDTAIIYAKAFIKHDGDGFYGLIEPTGNVKELLIKYRLIIV